ncbi:MAG: site-specific integrase [Planctomycetota bacterium]
MTRKSDAQKPSKPYSDYPLSAHPCGQWCKKIYGRIYYFGPWDQPEEAKAEYLRRLSSITGSQDDDREVTIRQLCNQFLNTKKLLVERGKLSQRTWNDYKEAAERLIKYFRPTRPITSLRVADFEHLYRDLSSTWSPTTLNNFVIRAKAILTYAYNQELIEAPIRTGVVFKRASAEEMRLARAKRQPKFFEASEVRTLVDKANPRLKAMILCGINLGFGNADCSRLEIEMLDLETGWFSQMRQKTGILRMGKLWPETIDALQKVIALPRPPCEESLSDRVFLTRNGNEYCPEGSKRDAITKQFYWLTGECDLRRKGVGFYALRHVTQTIGDQTGDALAVKMLMGHADNSISATYREHFERDRVEKVCSHIREWYLAGQNSEI